LNAESHKNIVIGGIMSSTRLEKQVEKLEAELKEKKAQISREKRKERGGQLVSLGIMFEAAFRRMGPAEKNRVKGWAEPLDARNKQRVFAAFERLGREEKAPEAAAEMPNPESLHSGRAHLPVSSGN
jgi:hypothetical protein